MPQGMSNVVHQRLNNLLLKICQEKGAIKTETIDEVCGISKKSKPDSRNRKRADYIAKFRDIYNADLTYDRGQKNYKLENYENFSVNLNLVLRVTPVMLSSFAAGSIFLKKFLPHLEKSYSELEAKLEQVFGKELLKEGRDLASSVTLAMPTAKLDGKVFSILQQAVREKKTVSFNYTSVKSREAGITKRYSAFSPWKLYFTDKSWYVLGGERKRPNGISCKLCRLDEVKIGGSKDYMGPPEGHEPDAVLSSIWSARPGMPAIEVELSFLPPLSSTIREMEWPKGVSIKDGDREGEVILQTKVPDLHGVAFFVLAGAPYAAARKPEKLCHLIVELNKRQLEAQEEILAIIKEKELQEAQREIYGEGDSMELFDEEYEEYLKFISENDYDEIMEVDWGELDKDL